MQVAGEVQGVRRVLREVTAAWAKSVRAQLSPAPQRDLAPKLFREPGVVASRSFLRSAASKVLAARKACSTVGYTSPSNLIGVS